MTTVAAADSRAAADERELQSNASAATIELHDLLSSGSCCRHALEQATNSIGWEVKLQVVTQVEKLQAS